MTRFVVDTSVAVKWFLLEVHSESASALLQQDHQILAPDLIWAEFGNVLWKKWRRKEIDADIAEGILRDFRRFPLEIHDSERLLQLARAIATEFERTVYDCLYLALAQRTEGILVTADSKFHDALKTTRLDRMLLRIEDLPV
ncbi:MAG: type II toxin-antitoxin system VapC family toxin [Gammaproteobacteria bacterium]